MEASNIDRIFAHRTGKECRKRSRHAGKHRKGKRCRNRAFEKTERKECRNQKAEAAEGRTSRTRKQNTERRAVHARDAGIQRQENRGVCSSKDGIRKNRQGLHRVEKHKHDLNGRVQKTQAFVENETLKETGST